MYIRIDNVGVDSGMIIVADTSIIEKGYLDEKRNKHVFNIPNGTYKAKLVVYKTWNGTVQTKGIVKVKTGEIVVTDPCYIIGMSHVDWMNFLHEIYKNFGSKTERKNRKYLDDKGILIADNMGGDGVYDCALTMKRIKKL